MAASSGSIGKDATISYATSSGGTYTAVGEVIDITPPDFSVGEDVEFTHYGSDNDTKEFKPGWKELGEAGFQINFVAAQYNTLVGLLGTERWWKIQTADTTSSGSTDVFPAYIKRISKAIPIKDRITATVTLRPTASNTFTSGT